MKAAKLVLITYCFIIGGVALLDSYADPTGQPLKNGVTIITMAATLLAVFQKQKLFLLFMPLYSISYAFFSISKNGTLNALIPALAGLSIPLLLIYLNFKLIKDGETQKITEHKSSDQ